MNAKIQVNVRSAFTLVEVLVAMAIATLIIVSVTTLLFSMGELWGRNSDARLFDLHARNLTRFIQRELATASLPPVGGAFTLTSSATGFTPASRQWYRDNFPIQGATTSTHAIAAATGTHAGTYSVTLTTPTGELIASNAFKLTINAGSGTGNNNGNNPNGGNNPSGGGGGGGGAPSLLWLCALAALLALRAAKRR